jgi:uncharacterized membrane protein
MFRKAKVKQPGIIASLRRNFAELWRHLFAGLMVWVPLILTIWICWFFVNKFVVGVDDFIGWAIAKYNTFLIDGEAQYHILGWFPELPYQRGFGFGLVLVLFLGTGVFARYLVGQKIIAVGEYVLQQIPFISRVYRAVQQIRDTFVGRKGAVFQKVCLIEYPRAGMIAVAFVTSYEQGLVQKMTNKELVAVFVPTTPNPTSGYLVYLPPGDVTELDITVEEAMKLIVSAGAYIPGTKDDVIAALKPADKPAPVDPASNQ